MKSCVEDENFIIFFLKKIWPLRKIVKGIRKLYNIARVNIKCKRITKKYGIKKNRILFYTFQCQFTCNCKYIVEELLKRKLDYEIFFVIDKNSNVKDFPENIKLIEKFSPEYFYVLATAGIWFDNAMNIVWYYEPKNKNQLYINTWHGSLGIKRIYGNWYWRAIARYSNKKIDYFITDSVFEENVFKNSFWPDVKDLKFGHARNDLLFDLNKLDLIKEKVCKYYGISKESKIFMYAPTFRDKIEDVDAIKIDYLGVKKALEEKFGGSWVLLSRLHYKNAKNLNTQNLFKNIKGIIDASNYPDMQELMAASDIGVTDYSSWIFDYVLLKRPAFIYAEDINKYVNSRGFYYSLNDTPFDIAETNEQLLKFIKNFDNNQYLKKVEKFLTGKGCYENGDASKKIVDFICNNV